MIFWIGLGVLIFFGFGIYYVRLTLNIATGYVAKIMASGIFVAGRDEASIRNEELNILSFISTKIEEDKKMVTASCFGLNGRKAIYREGMGCSLISEAAESELNKKVFTTPISEKTDQSQIEWPLGDLNASNEESPIDKTKLNAVIENSFLESDPKKIKRTRAVIVIRKGKIISEKYANGFDATSRMAGWSMTKSVTNALVGVLVNHGKLDINNPVPVAEWQSGKDKRSEITLDQLLRMSSGLDFGEVYSRPSDATKMLFLSKSASEFAAKSRLIAQPDTLWNYSSGTSNIISGIIRQQFKDDREYLEFPYKNFFSKIGMNSAIMETDSSGTFVGSSFMFATARDWARFGLLYLNGGTCNNERVLPEGWTDYSRKRTNTMKQGIYGAHFYCNGKTEYYDLHGVSKYYPKVPDDMYYASGFEGNYVVIIPSREIVVVRLGQTINKHAFSLGDFLGDILNAIPD